ncbi:hypothetical protein FRB99_005985 [Tulasnella sp. 403]|nr:hypothetical protein FRB99_005985 [Tulasnella sp. 403]
MRPASSASFVSRPSTSHSQHRPASRISQRPGSRISYRTPSRHTTRFASDLQTLVTQVTGLTSDKDIEEFNETCDAAGRSLEANRYTGLSPDMGEVDARLDGLVEKAEIKGQDSLASALTETRRLLKQTVKDNEGEDGVVKEKLLPEHIHFLLLLSHAPDSPTLEIATKILHAIHNPPELAPQLTWADILAEEPFEGDHWLTPPSPSSSLSDWSDDLPRKPARGNSPTESSGSLEFLIDDSPITNDSFDAQHEANARRTLVEELQSQQYWTAKWESPIESSTLFKIGEPSTLGPAIAAMEATGDLLGSWDQQIYILEFHAVREVLMSLQGIASALFEIDNSTQLVKVRSSGPRLPHMSPVTFHSILSTFASITTTLHRLRMFVTTCGTGRPHAQSPSTHTTLLAFVDGVEQLLIKFTRWCAEMEEAICLAKSGHGTQLVVSLLNLKQETTTRLSSTFDVLWNILQTIAIRSMGQNASAINFDFTSIEPGILSKQLLDDLLLHGQSHLSMGDLDTASSLIEVFTSTATPLWALISIWLKNGAILQEIDDPTYRPLHNLTSDPEFFIQSNSSLLNVVDFWEAGIVLREIDEVTSSRKDGTLVPLYLSHVAEDLLSAGKAVGLLRALGVHAFFYPKNQSEWMANWVLFNDILKGRFAEGNFPSNAPPPDSISASSGPGGPSGKTENMSHLSVDMIKSRLLDYLTPFFDAIQSRLNRVLVEDCKLWKHLSCIEDIFLTGRGDVVAQFSARLFAKRGSLHRSVVAILDLCLSFVDTFWAYTNDTSADISRQSLILLREQRQSGPRRKRRLRKSQRRLRTNLVAFTHELASISSEDDSDSSEEFDLQSVIDDRDEVEEGISFVEASFLSRIEGMSVKLDDLVRYFHRTVEDSSLDGTEPAFSILSFMLEDWDR